MLGGVLLVAQATFFAVSPGGNLQDIVLLVAVFLTAVGFLGFHALQKEGYGRVGRGYFYTAIVGVSVQIVALVVSLLPEGTYLGELLGGLLFGIGSLMPMMGYVLYGVATLQANLVPRWCGLAFIVVGMTVAVPQPLLPTGEYASGVVMDGPVWLVLGHARWSRRRPAARQPSRAN
jgi:uncharacterized membrane protein